MKNNKEAKNETVWTKPFYGGIEYEMPAQMAKTLLLERHGEDKNMNPQDYLKKIVNETFRIKGYCVKVTTI